MSVIKVNYKLEIPHYDQYMQWHVSFGIAMVFISFFHLSWHLKYYVNFRKSKTVKNDVNNMKVKLSFSDFSVLLFLLGFITIISQVVFIREFITVFSGNELIVGIVLAAWMLLTGWGAYFARRKNWKFG